MLRIATLREMRATSSLLHLDFAGRPRFVSRDYTWADFALPQMHPSTGRTPKP